MTKIFHWNRVLTDGDQPEQYLRKVSIKSYEGRKEI